MVNTVTTKPIEVQFVLQRQFSYLTLVVSRQKLLGKISLLLCTADIKVNMANMFLTKHISVAMDRSSQLIFAFCKKIVVSYLF